MCPSNCRRISFGKSTISRFGSLIDAVRGPKYNGKYLQSLAVDLLDKVYLKQTLTNVVIPTFDIKLLQPVIFSTDEVWY